MFSREIVSHCHVWFHFFVEESLLECPSVRKSMNSTYLFKMPWAHFEAAQYRCCSRNSSVVSNFYLRFLSECLKFGDHHGRRWCLECTWSRIVWARFERKLSIQLLRCPPRSLWKCLLFYGNVPHLELSDTGGRRDHCAMSVGRSSNVPLKGAQVSRRQSEI